MGAKNRAKKRMNKTKQIKQKYNAEIYDGGDKFNVNFSSNEENRMLAKFLPFSSISNKQFKNVGLIPQKINSNNVTTIPLRFSSKLMPIFKKMFNISKSQNAKADSVQSTFQNESYITLISFQNYIVQGQQPKISSSNFPTLQITRIGTNNTENLIGLYLSETNLKPEILPSVNKLPLSAPENKVTKKRSFFNEIWKKKPTVAQQENLLPPSSPTPIAESKLDNNQPIPLSTASPTSNIQQVQSADSCIVCNKQAFIAERIQIGADVFHNNCFKCNQCSKCLYRGKWNKHQDQYLCDNCNKKLTWSFMRR